MPLQTKRLHPSSQPHALHAIAAALLIALSGCGAGSGGGIVETPTAFVGCNSTSTANTVGADDPFYAAAWHLENTGPTQGVSADGNSAAKSGIDANVKALHNAGQGCTGKGVTIAVVDSGLDIKHEDLVDRVIKDKSFNFANNSNDPSPAANAAKIDHGTGVAGVAAATGWNGKGSRGIAPFASLVGFAPLDAGSDSLKFGAVSLADASAESTKAFGTRVADAKVAIFNFSAGSDYALPPSVPADETNEAAGHQAARWGVKNGRDAGCVKSLQSVNNEMPCESGAFLFEAKRV
jgi:subtilisin family serine protease